MIQLEIDITQIDLLGNQSDIMEAKLLNPCGFELLTKETQHSHWFCWVKTYETKSKILDIKSPWLFRNMYIYIHCMYIYIYGLWYMYVYIYIHHYI